jgi:hypothetical protein
LACPLLGVFLAAAAPLPTPSTIHEWRSRDYMSLDSPVGCAIILAARRSDSWITMTLSLLGGDEHSRKTELRLTARRRSVGDLLRETPVPISDAWLRTTTGTSVGALSRITTEADFVASSPGLQAFADLFRGLRSDGAVLGVRFAGATTDQVEQTGPPPKKVSDAVVACLNRLTPEGR